MDVKFNLCLLLIFLAAYTQNAAASCSNCTCYSDCACFHVKNGCSSPYDKWSGLLRCGPHRTCCCKQ